MINRIYKRINAIDLTCDFAYEELFSIFSNMTSIPFYTYKLKKNSIVSFYRSRKNNCFTNFYDFKDISYPPANKITNYSRVNKPLQSLFYASDKWTTNLMELKLFWTINLLDNDIFWVTTGKWDLIADIEIIIIPDFDNFGMQQIIDIVSADLNTTQLDFLNFINEKFKSQAHNNQNLYKVTSAFCNSILYSNIRDGKTVDGILFTSVQDGKGLNFALNPLVVEKKIKLNSVVKHQLRKRTDKNRNLPLIDNINTPIIADKLDYINKKIIWKKE